MITRLRRNLHQNPAVYVTKTTGATSISSVWIENAGPGDVIVLDAAAYVVTEKCHIVGGEPNSQTVRAIRLKNKAYNNIIRDNFIAMQGAGLPGTGLTAGDQIEVEDGCRNNRIENNLALRTAAVGVPVIHRDRTHVLGQRQAMSHAKAAPVSGTWERGDIVFNSEPSPQGFAGWICIDAGSPGRWKPFGAIAP